MKPVYFSRVRLSDDLTVRALRPLLNTGGSSHALIWSLFADEENRKRDFLYSESRDGWFYILSDRKPRNTNNLFQLDEPKIYAPVLHRGDNLGFSLRANPVVRNRIEGTRKSSKHDVVMAALRDVSDRAGKRQELIWQAGVEWFGAQGDKHGFNVETINDDKTQHPHITGYRQHRIPRTGSGDNVRFSSLDFEGRLTVMDPDRFLDRLRQGFGSAKAYGCGLMLIRRI